MFSSPAALKKLEPLFFPYACLLRPFRHYIYFPKYLDAPWEVHFGLVMPDLYLSFY